MRTSTRRGITTRPGISEARRQQYQRKNLGADSFDPEEWRDRREQYHVIALEERRTAAGEMLRRAEHVERLAADDNARRDLFAAEADRLRTLARQIV